MTDDEFKTWDRHKAENLQVQRDDALAQVAVLEGTLGVINDSHRVALAAKEAEVQAFATQHTLDQQMIVTLGGVDQAAKKLRDQKILTLMAQQEATARELAALTSEV